MPVTGDFDELDRLIDRFELVERGELQEALSRNLAEETLELVSEGFENHEDPYGGAWDGLKARAGDTLRDTSHLANSFHVHDVQPDSFSIRTGVWYAVVHQQGMTITPKKINRRGQKRLVFPDIRAIGGITFAKQVTVPQRRMLPDAGDIPVEWMNAWDEVADEFFDEFFG